MGVPVPKSGARARKQTSHAVLQRTQSLLRPVQSMTPEIFPLIFGAFFILIIAIAIYSYYAAKKRREELAGLAQHLGFQFLSDGLAEPPRSGFFDSIAGMFGPSADAVFLQRFAGFSPFGQGYAPDMCNLLVGSRDGADWYMFDYSYKTDSTNSEGKTETTTHNYGIVAARIPVGLPGLNLAPENVFHRIGTKLGLQELNFELEEFNRKYFVRAGDPKGAYDLLHPKAIEYLMSKPSRHWQLSGFYVLIASGTNSPAEAMQIFQEIRGFISLIPEYYKQDHGFTPRWTSLFD